MGKFLSNTLPTFFLSLSLSHTLSTFSLSLLNSYFTHFFSFPFLLYQFLIKTYAIHPWDYF